MARRDQLPKRLSGEEAVYYVYIMASKPSGTLYIGVTGDLVSRVQQHRSGESKGFTAQYKVHRLVHYELFGDIMAAMVRSLFRTRWRASDQDGPWVAGTSPAMTIV
jgi:putative endonuclease